VLQHIAVYRVASRTECNGVYGVPKLANTAVKHKAAAASFRHKQHISLRSIITHSMQYSQPLRITDQLIIKAIPIDPKPGSKPPPIARVLIMLNLSDDCSKRQPVSEHSIQQTNA
jgi:hypothetical protein